MTVNEYVWCGIEVMNATRIGTDKRKQMGMSRECVCWSNLVNGHMHYNSSLCDWLNAEWLYKLTVQKLVIVIRSLDNSEVIERWQFNVDCEKTSNDNKVL